MKGRMKKSTGGVNDAEKDEKDKPADRSEPNNVAKDAEERKHGGRTKKAHGGKSVGKIEGKASEHMGRKPRKSGGRTGSESSPLTGAHSGKQPGGRSVMSESMD